MTSTPAFTVYMGHDLVNQLDESFSPMDGIAAIDEVFIGLPQVHQSKEPKRRRLGKTVRVYRRSFKWFPSCGISYVEVGNELHVIDVWHENEANRSYSAGDPTDRVPRR